MQNRDRLPFLIVPLAAAIVVLPLLLHGCSCGHDLSFHLLSWQEAAQQFANGTLHPRWAYSAAYGAGEPRFVFYPPLSWTLGALLTLAASLVSSAFHLSPGHAFALVPLLYSWLALSAAGLTMYRLAARFCSPTTSLLVAAAYLANPYTLFTAIERSAFAELLAAAIFPLLLSALLPQSKDPEPEVSLPGVAVPLALLWLTNAPAAVIGSYTVAAVTGLRAASMLLRRSKPQAILALVARVSAAALLAFGIAAFYIGPVLLERPWVQIAMAVLPGLRPEDNTLFHHTADAFHDQVLHTASTLALLLLSSVAVACVLAWQKPPHRSPVGARHILLQIAFLAVLIALLLTPLSLPLWHHLPELAFLQFPWRLLSLLAPLAALAIGLALPKLHLGLLGRAAVSLVLPALLAAPAYPAFRQACDSEDTPQARFALFHSPVGEEPTDEYTPVAADNDSLKDNNPSFRLLPATANDDTPPAPSDFPGIPPLALDLSPTEPSLLILNLRDYPTWVVTLNGQIDRDRNHRSDGLLTLSIPAGHDVITVTQQTPPLEYAADTLSVLATSLTAVLIVRRRRPSGATPVPSIAP